jgi:hypothetical protein
MIAISVLSLVSLMMGCCSLGILTCVFLFLVVGEGDRK